MTAKQFVFALLSAFLPLLYTLITGAAPDFGGVIDVQTFVALVLWLIGLPLGGWQLLKGRLLYKLGKDGSAKLGSFVLKG